MAEFTSEQFVTQKRDRNFLSRLIHEQDGGERRHTRRATNLQGKIYYLKHGIRGYRSTPCIMRDLSQGGALIQLAMYFSTKQYVYLVIDNLPYKFTAVIIGRSEKGYHLKFANELSPEAVESIANGRLAKGVAIDRSQNARTPDYFKSTQ